MSNSILVIGLMSGTSMDGIDGTVLKTNGINFSRTEIQASVKYKKTTKDILLSAQQDPLDFIKNKDQFNLINKLVTIDHITLVRKILKQTISKPDLIGFHGQTIYHSFKKKLSIQLGDPQFLSNITKLPVISKFRQKDIKNGGHGAPLSPIYHMAMAKEMNLQTPIAFVNIGGVSNLTYFDNKQLIGFDTGPGNGLMDFFIQRKINKPYDKDGILASKGKINFEILKALKSNIYFKKNFPKSLDKLYFLNELNSFFTKNYLIEDILATLLEFTVSTISNSLYLLPKKPNQIILLGGGQFNSLLVEKLKEHTKSKVYLSSDFNLHGQYIEAELFAYLSARINNNLPTTFPSTTGVKKPICGGIIFTPEHYINAPTTF